MLMVPLLILLGTLLLGTFTGWLGHWALHQRWSGRFYEAHRTHHRLYPPKDFRSDLYRNAKKDNTTFFLGPAIAFVVVVWMALLIWFQVGWPVYVAVIAFGGSVGYLHEYLHEAFHLENHWLDSHGWFQALRILHLEHHRSVKKNLGILWYGWDRLFRTFK